MVKAALDVKIGPYEQAEMPAAASAKDLRGTGPDRAVLTVQAETAPLTYALTELIEQLTEKERTGMLSNLLSDAWINGPLTPALEAAVSGLSEPEEESGEEPEEAWDDEGSYDESDG